MSDILTTDDRSIIRVKCLVLCLERLGWTIQALEHPVWYIQGPGKYRAEALNIIRASGIVDV